MQSGSEIAGQRAFDRLLAESASSENSVSHHCARFVRLLDSLRPLQLQVEFNGNKPALADMEGRAHAFLTQAAALRRGLFRDMEIVCLLCQLTRQILLCLSSSAFVSCPDTSIVSAISDAAPVIDRRASSASEVCTTELTKSMVAESESIADDNLIHLAGAVKDLKDRLAEASQALQAIFFCKSTPKPSFLFRFHLARFLHFFLHSQSGFHPNSPASVRADPWISDPRGAPDSGAGEFPEIESPIGNPVADRVVLQLLDSGGPFIVGICGPAGLGKTSIASSVALNCDINRRFIGGIHWISVGQNVDPVLLQCRLWNAVSGSQTASFNSVEEGLVALVNKFSDRLPSLLILDDVHASSQLQALLCLEGKERGRVLVTARNQQILQSTDAHTHSLSGLEEEDAVELFQWVAPWDSPLTSEQKNVATKLARKCNGSPLLVQAVGSTLYGVEDKQKMIRQLLVDAEGKFAEEGKKPVDQARGHDRKSQTKNSVSDEQKIDRTTGCPYSVLFTCFSALGIVHPVLQECFLDLAAFPQGEWVTLSKLEDIWLAFSYGLNREEIVVVLSILVSRSMLDWRLNRLDTADSGYQMEFKLFEAFHQLASRIIHQESQVYNANVDTDVCKKSFKPFNNANGLEGRKFSQKCMRGLKNILGFHNRTMSCSGEDMKLKSRELASDSENNYEILRSDDMKSISSAVFEVGGQNDSRNGSDKRCWNSRFQKEYRLFDMACNINLLQGHWLDEPLVSRTTKLSLCSTDVARLPTHISCPYLRVALLRDNAMLSFIPSGFLRSMTQLLVLDLKGCTSLRQLPRAISALKSLQLLDLSACSSLQSLPSSFGDLKNMRLLRICGCTSLTRLPRTIGSLPKLEILQLNGCMQLRTLPPDIGKLSLLKILDLKDCLSLQYLPASVRLLKELQFIDLSGCSNLSYTLPYCEQLQLLAIGNLKTRSMAVPTGLWTIGQIEVLRMASLKNIIFLPCSVSSLQHMRHLNLSNCRRLEFLPEEIGNLSLLQELDLSHTAIRKLPDSLGQMRNLLQLYLKGCCRLICIPSSISYLPKLRYLHMSECWDLVLLPKSMGNANSLCELVELDLSCCSIKSMPSFSCHALPKLMHLKLSGCYLLNCLPPTMELLTSLKKIDLEGCQALTSLKGTGLAKLEKLAWLSLRNCTGLTSLPIEEISLLNSLKYLDVSGCTGLLAFPQAILDRAQEGDLTLIRWGAVWP